MPEVIYDKRELVMSAFLMISLFVDAFHDACPLTHQRFAQHPCWSKQKVWKN
jgi:hypothetical protein